ncbi:PucR family transcriptional regulator [Paenibacillus sp. GCM10027628]|uniref:PucR family transcriptional regulator n=1 Tax=Paenibacillus sp. GCM10027628 TaxID=3273413 RepID=UPI003624CF3B
MKLNEALSLSSLSRVRIVAGADSLERTIRWTHVVDLPDPLPWVNPGDLMLTTGYAWPRDDDQQRDLIRVFAEIGLAGLGFAVPNFFESIPAATREAAEKHHFPLLEIPWEIPFSSITKEVHGAIIANQYELLEQSEAIHRELMRSAVEAESLQDIAVLLGRLIGRSLTIEHPDGALLASCIRHEEAAEWRPMEDEGFTTGMIRENCSFLKAMADTNTQPLHVPADDGNSLPARYVWPIHIKKELVGLLWVIEGEFSLTELEIRAIEHASLVTALHISGLRQRVSFEAQIGLSFLESLQEGSFQPTLQSLKRAEILRFDPEGTYRMGLLSLILPVPLSPEGIVKRERFVERLRRAMLTLGVPTLLSYNQNQITFLLPERLTGKEIWQKFQNETTLLFAVSRAHKGIVGVQKGYQEVVSMLPHLTPGDFYDYEDLLVPRLLLGEEDARELFLEKMFKPLQQTRNGDVLVETLVEAARHGFQHKKTAEKLSIHPKTLRYRLDKAIEIGGFSLDDEDTRFKIQLAARILSLKYNK